MNETTLLIAALAGVMVLLVAYLALREREISRKLALMESGIDTLGSEVFKVAKELEKSRRDLHEKLVRLELDGRDGPDLAQTALRRCETLKEELEALQTRLEGLGTSLEEKVSRMEGQIRQVVFAAEHSVPNEQKILQLHAQGLDSETIAKQLRLGKGEVELVLRFAKYNG